MEERRGSGSNLPPRSPAQNARAKISRPKLPHGPPLLRIIPFQIRSEERKVEGRRVVSRLAGARCEAAERGRGAEQKGGRNLPKKGVDRGRSVLVIFSLSSRRRLPGRWSSSSLWTLVVVVSLDSCRLLDFSAGHLLSSAERIHVPRSEARAQ